LLIFNSARSQLYWTVGDLLHRQVLDGTRAKQGANLIGQLGERLAQEFDRGFESKNLYRMIQFAQAFPSAEKVASLMRLCRDSLHPMLAEARERRACTPCA
jgi:hypothetical protein